jgi:hypothetical protein
MRAIRLLIATAMVLPLLVATGGRAVACSCAPMTAARTIHRADAIVVGHVVNQVELDPITTKSTLMVSGVYKGDVPSQITLVTDFGSGGGGTCAVLYPLGATVDPMVLFRHDDGTFEVSACSLLALDAVRARLGQAKPPPPGPSTGGAIAGVPPSIVGPGLSWPAVFGGSAVALLLMAWALRRVPRERAVRTVDGVAQLQAKARASSGPRGDAGLQR